MGQSSSKKSVDDEADFVSNIYTSQKTFPQVVASQRESDKPKDPDLLFQHQSWTTKQACVNLLEASVGDRLVLSNNQITAVPSVLIEWRFAHLTELDLSNNCLFGVLDFSGILNLKTLRISNNPDLCVVPIAPRALKQLYLNNSGIESASKMDNLRLLVNLERLEMKSNQLTTLPNWLAEMIALREMEVSDNALWRLPMSIGEMPNLESFSARGNPLPKPLKRMVLSH